jgi:hypothetical protein
VLRGEPRAYRHVGRDVRQRMRPDEYGPVLVQPSRPPGLALTCGVQVRTTFGALAYPKREIAAREMSRTFSAGCRLFGQRVCK